MATQFDFLAASDFQIIAVDRYHTGKVARLGMTIIDIAPCDMTNACFRAVVVERSIIRDDRALIIQRAGDFVVDRIAVLQRALIDQRVGVEQHVVF